jgi:hypothetical protein
MTEHDIPQERDLPAGRFLQLKDNLMAQIDQIEQHPEPEPRAATMATHRRWRRIGLAAAALAAGFGLATSLVVGGDDSASANTAERTDDGAIVITIRDARHPKDLQRRLNDLGVPAVVDFLVDGGGGCEPDRSTGWVVGHEPGAGRAEMLLTPLPSPHDDPKFLLHPDQIRPGETAVLEFQVDEEPAGPMVMVRQGLTSGPVGPCVPVDGGTVVDAEEGDSGG